MNIRSSEREWWHLLDSTFSFSVTVPFNQNVALKPPSGTPWVFNSVIFLSIHLTISDSKDTVIKFSSAKSWVNTSLIKLERQMISLDCDGNWLLSNRGHKGKLFAGSDINTVRNCPGFVLIGVTTRSANSSVWISWFQSNSMILDIIECQIHESTITSMVSVACWTINELLLREWGQFVGWCEMSAL